MRPSRLLVLSLALAGGILLGGCAAPEATGPAAAASPAPAIPSSTPVVGCSAVTTEPTPAGSGQLTTISASDFALGPDAANVTLLYYCDFQSAQCELFNGVLDQLVADHPADLKVVMRPFAVPAAVVPSLDKSELAARAALAAGQQGQFWQMRDLLIYCMTSTQTGRSSHPTNSKPGSRIKLPDSVWMGTCSRRI